MSTWKQLWQETTAAPPRSGGQGTVKYVTRKGSDDSTIYVLKLLSRNNDAERRARMRREVIALDTLRHKAIPRVRWHNLDLYEDRAVPLAFVQDYVPGPTLEELVQRNGPLPAATAVQITSQLLDVLAYCHSQGCCHRDIKPDNIVVSSENPLRISLIDFGQNFNSEEPSSLVTSESHHLGNRFLMLPELRVPGSNKQDPRSDLTACVGILYYCLTGEPPTDFLDENGRAPHQRLRPATRLAETPGLDLPALLALFDVGFQHRIDQRHQSADALHEALSKLPVVSSRLAQTTPLPDLIEQVRGAYRSNSTHLRLKPLQEVLAHFDATLSRIVNDVAGELAAGFSVSQSSHSTNLRKLTTTNHFEIRQHTTSRGFSFRYLVSILGSEVVVETEALGIRKPVLRKPLANYTMTGEDKLAFKRFLVEGLRDAPLAP